MSRLIRTLLIAGFATAFAAQAWPAHAQTGALRGRVLDDQGRPVDRCEIILDFVGDMKRQVKTITDRNGDWVRVGLPVGGGTWTITAQKDKLSGSIDKVTIKLGETQKVADIIIMTAEARASGKRVMSAEDADAAKKVNAEMDKLLEEANAAITGGNLELAVTKLTALAEKVPTCASCYTKIGEVQLQRKDLAAAEAAFLKAIEIDPKQPGPYNQLAAIYNEQRKFEEATKMSTKATELMGAAGSTDPAAIFNQGVIFWNQSKIVEAKAQWAKAVELDPKMADAHYWLGMANVNQGNVADARKAFETYLQLAPKGQYADTAKAILASIK